MRQVVRQVVFGAVAFAGAFVVVQEVGGDPLEAAAIGVATCAVALYVVLPRVRALSHQPNADAGPYSQKERE